MPVVPLPNDLALRTGVIVVPPSPTDSPAQKEFNEQYLGKLNGFPYESTASVTVSGDLKPESVNAKTVLAFDVTNPAAPAPVAITPTFADKKITIPPPAGNWLRAHKYAIAVDRRRERRCAARPIRTSSARRPGRSCRAGTRSSPAPT